MENTTVHRSLEKSRSRSRSKDRISDLPTSVIQHILAFLPTKDAIRTCVLSKRWQYLWTSIPNLLFHCESSKSKEVYRFASSIEKILIIYSSSKIKKFLVDFYYDYGLKDQVDSWLHFAANHEVEELCLKFIRSYRFPKFLYTNSSVKKMSLKSIDFDGRVEGFYWTSLKVLTLTCTRLENEMIRSILLGSPLIKYLNLSGCMFNDSVGIIDATGTNLKELVIDSCRGENHVVQQINISGTNLLSLTMVGYMESSMLTLGDVSLLVEANIDFESDRFREEMFQCFFQKLSHVNKLIIGKWWLQFLSEMEMDQARFLPSARKILEIYMELTKGHLPGLLALLYSSPYLEQLTINVMDSDGFEGKLPGNSRGLVYSPTGTKTAYSRIGGTLSENTLNLGTSGSSLQTISSVI